MCWCCHCVLPFLFTFVHFQPNNHNNFLSTSQYHGIYERHAEWENIVIPQMHQYNQQIHPYQHMTNNHNSRHKMSYLIKSLAPSSNYEARVQARNDHGWNKLSSTFHFSTRAEGKMTVSATLFYCLRCKYANISIICIHICNRDRDRDTEIGWDICRKFTFALVQTDTLTVSL